MNDWERAPHREGYDGHVDGGPRPALDLLLRRGWSEGLAYISEGKPPDCTMCPFSSRSIEPYHQIDNDVTEAHYACSLLREVVWGEYPPCSEQQWRERARAELPAPGAPPS